MFKSAICQMIGCTLGPLSTAHCAIVHFIVHFSRLSIPLSSCFFSLENSRLLSLSFQILSKGQLLPVLPLWSCRFPFKTFFFYFLLWYNSHYSRYFLYFRLILRLAATSYLHQPQFRTIPRHQPSML